MIFSVATAVFQSVHAADDIEDLEDKAILLQDHKNSENPEFLTDVGMAIDTFISDATALDPSGVSGAFATIANHQKLMQNIINLPN